MPNSFHAYRITVLLLLQGAMICCAVLTGCEPSLGKPVVVSAAQLAGTWVVTVSEEPPNSGAHYDTWKLTIEENHEYSLEYVPRGTTSQAGKVVKGRWDRETSNGIQFQGMPEIRLDTDIARAETYSDSSSLTLVFYHDGRLDNPIFFRPQK